jgi:dolichol kinase
MSELNRQFVHIAGILFIILAQFIGKLIVIWYALAAAGLLIWSLYIRRQSQFLSRIEAKFRPIILKLERDHVNPFIGAMWFFAGSGAAFLIFPHLIASAACTMLAIGDGLATIVGQKWGKHKLLKGKSLEGSLACWFGSLTAAVFLPFLKVLIGATIATFVELLPALTKHKNLIDDNWLIPIVTGIVIWLL